MNCLHSSLEIYLYFDFNPESFSLKILVEGFVEELKVKVTILFEFEKSRGFQGISF